MWECAIDLSAHLCDTLDIRATQHQWSSVLPQGTRVLELGCGHGLPGILLMLTGCEVHFQACPSARLSSTALTGGCGILGAVVLHICSARGCLAAALNTVVHAFDSALQDYNAEVLRSLTALNVSRNIECHPGIAALRDTRPRYFAGLVPGISYSLTVLSS